MTSQTETAILAGGCFWGMQDLLRRYPGVLQTRVGYTGGDVPNATYRNHGNHAEAIEIIFDPAVISYRQILEFFFQIHDPSTPNRQGNDLGPSYRSAITPQRTQRDVAASTAQTLTLPNCGRPRGHRNRTAGPSGKRPTPGLPGAFPNGATGTLSPNWKLPKPTDCQVSCISRLATDTFI